MSLSVEYTGLCNIVFSTLTDNQMNVCGKFAFGVSSADLKYYSCGITSIPFAIPLSAIIVSPGSTKSRKPLFIVINLSETFPSHSCNECYCAICIYMYLYVV